LKPEKKYASIIEHLMDVEERQKKQEGEKNLDSFSFSFVNWISCISITQHVFYRGIPEEINYIS